MTRMIALLSHPSPILRYLVLTRLEDRGEDDEEARELASLIPTDRYLTEILRYQADDGSFRDLPQGSTLGPVYTTSFALSALGYLGLDAGHSAVTKAAEFLTRRQKDDGSWPMGRDESGREGYDMIPLQTALPLRGLCSVGMARSDAAERGFAWLLEEQLPDGAWPTGRAQSAMGYVAGYRRLPQSRWGCRSNTTGAVAALALHPSLAFSLEARRGLDHLLSRETVDEALIGFETARLTGYQRVTGFMTHFARFDIAFILSLAARCGASRDDSRVEAIAAKLEGFGDALLPCRVNEAARRWVTYDVQRSLRLLTGDWVGTEIHTPYRSYPRERKRF
jgi:hypothetical protein